MFCVKDKVFYGTIGVCEVVKIDVPPIDGVTGIYYFLKPHFNKETLIYVPVETTIPMRFIISKKECKHLEEMAKSSFPLDENIFYEQSEYSKIIDTQDVNAILLLIRYLYRVKRMREEIQKKMKTFDFKYLKMAQKLLFQEMSVVLEVPYEDVEEKMISYLSNK